MLQPKQLSLLLPAACLCLLASSCSLLPAKTRAMQFNNSLAEINHNLTAQAKNWGVTLKQCASIGDYHMLNKQRIHMEEYIEKSTARLQNMDAYGIGGERFKKEEINFLDVEGRVVLLGCGGFESLKIKSTEQDKQEVMDTLNSMIRLEQQQLLVLKKVQLQYAHDNGLQIKPEPLGGGK